jgi:hypothetical protein
MIRKDIREAAKTALEASFDLKTVRIGRRHNYTAAQLNAASIYTDSEESEVITMKPLTYENRLALTVEFYLQPSGIDLGEDALDAILETSDAAILSAVAAVSGVFDVALDSLSIEGEGEEADADYIKATRSYRVEYHSGG